MGERNITIDNVYFSFLFINFFITLQHSTISSIAIIGSIKTTNVPPTIVSTIAANTKIQNIIILNVII